MWSKSAVQIDDYLKYGVGTYKVEITNSGSGWECTFVGYVELDGNPLTKPVGLVSLGLVGLGAVGGLLAARRGDTAVGAGPDPGDVFEGALEPDGHDPA